MRPVRRASFALLATLVAVAVPSLAHAQSCLGFPLQPSQRTLGFQYASGFELGGPGGFYSQVNRSSSAFLAEWVTYEIWDGADVIGRQTTVSTRLAGPVGRDRNSGAPGSLCTAYDLGAVIGDASAFRAGFGLFYALAGRFGSAYAGPMLLGAFSEEGNSTGVGLLAGLSGRLGPLMLNVAAEPPILPFEIDPTVHVRFGFAWGRAAQPQAPATPTPSRPAVLAVPAPSPAAPAEQPTPYALDDITAMVKNGVTTARILQLAQRACVSFRVNPASETELRRVGADPELLTGLRGACYSGN